MCKTRIGIGTQQPLDCFNGQWKSGFSKAVLAQRVLSAIIEVKLAADRLEETIPAIIDVGQEIDTVFSLGVICRFGEKMELPILERLMKLGIDVAPNAKINLGMGEKSSKHCL